MYEDTRLDYLCPQSYQSSNPEAVATDPGVGPPAGVPATSDGSGARGWISPSTKRRRAHQLHAGRAAESQVRQPEDAQGSPAGGRGEPRPIEAEARGRSPLVTTAGSGAQPWSSSDATGAVNVSDQEQGGVSPCYCASGNNVGEGATQGQARTSWGSESDGQDVEATAGASTEASVASPGDPLLLSQRRPGLVVQGVMGPLLAVSVHVDTLHMVYAVQVSEPTLLRVYAQPLGQPVREVLEVGPHTLELRRSAGSLRIFLRSHDLLAFVERGSAHWTVRIEVSAAYLMVHGLEQAMGLANELADALGLVTMQSVGRADLTCDMAGAYLRDEDLRDIIVQRASRKVAMARIQPTDDFGNELSDDDVCTESDVRAYRQGNTNDQLTGLVVGAGGAISLRIYDKRRELSLASRTHKREATEALWRAGGWDGQAPVFRTEFQLRGRVLKQLEITDPKALLARLDEVWQYCVRWCRIIVRGTNNRLTRCDLDPRWQLLQSTYFRHRHAVPAKRVYRRGGQRAEVAVSGCMSALAGHGVLLAFLVDYDKITAEALYAELKGVAGARLARIIVDEAVTSNRVDDVWTYFATRARCYRARFSSVDDSPEPAAEAA